MIDNAFKWLRLRRLSRRAQSLAGMAVSPIERELQLCLDCSRKCGQELLRRQLEAQIRELRKARQRIMDACDEKSLERTGIERVQKMVDRGLLTLEQSENLRHEHG